MPSGLGDYQPPTAVYRTVKLATTGNGYTRSASLSQSVKPGASDRFEIPVYADRSSQHILRVRLVYGRHDFVETPTIRLDLFVPRNPE
jgi:hypothetical protein